MKLQTSKVTILETLIQQHPELPQVLEEARERAKPNRRSIAEYQAAALYALAKPYDGLPILEVGTALGYSAVVLAKACPNSPITTLNPFMPEVEVAQENLAQYGNVTVKAVKSWDFMATDTATYGFIFVDGDHKRVKSDLPFWDRLVGSGLILFHDYSPAGTYRACVPVYEAVKEFAVTLGKSEPDVLVVDEGGVGMAGFIKGGSMPAAAGKSPVEIVEPLTLGKEIYQIAQAQGRSILSYDQLSALYKLAALVGDVSGDVVECGAGNGGSAALLWLGARRAKRPLKRTLWLFDTFTSMPAPGPFDPPKAHSKYASGSWCASSVEGARHTMDVLGVPDSAIVPWQGLFAETFPTAPIGDIAILHVDATLYESTKLALETWWPKVIDGGLLTVSAYGHWAGVRKAVDEYFGSDVRWQGLEAERVNIWLQRGVSYT